MTDRCIRNRCRLVEARFEAKNSALRHRFGRIIGQASSRGIQIVSIFVDRHVTRFQTRYFLFPLPFLRLPMPVYACAHEGSHNILTRSCLTSLQIRSVENLSKQFLRSVDFHFADRYASNSYGRTFQTRESALTQEVFR